MLLALTGYQVALVCVAALFIGFALITALVIPRSRPDFPGRRLGIFLGVCGVLFAAQLTAVLVLAEVGESTEPAREVAPTETTTTQPTETQPTETTPTETQTTETTTSETTTTETTPTGGQGDAAAGKAVFSSAGCVSCHTLAAAGATGTVGPNLDQVKPSYDRVVTQVTNGGTVMPSFKATLSEKQIQDVAAYVSSVAGT